MINKLIDTLINEYLKHSPFETEEINVYGLQFSLEDILHLNFDSDMSIENLAEMHVIKSDDVLVCSIPRLNVSQFSFFLEKRFREHHNVVIQVAQLTIGKENYKYMEYLIAEKKKREETIKLADRAMGNYFRGVNEFYD